MATFHNGTQVVTANSYRPMTAVSAEHENTTTAANFKDSAGNDLVCQITADALRVGDIYEYHAFVNVVDNNGADELTLLFRVTDGTTPTSLYAPAAFNASDADYVDVHGFLTCESVGTSGVMRFVGWTHEIKAGSATSIPIRAAATLDTTATISFNVNADWSAAHADNEVRLDQFLVRKANV